MAAVMCEMVTPVKSCFGIKMFSLPIPPAPSVFLPPYPWVTPVKICGYASGKIGTALLS